MSDHSHGAQTEHKEESMTSYTIVITLLMILLILTYYAYTLDLGKWNLAIAMAIAVIKASMVLMIFMHVRLSPKIVWAFSIIAFFFLAIMICGFENDFIGRTMDSPGSHALLSPEASAMMRGQ
jgi:cytochrome c oxidase subunit IV